MQKAIEKKVENSQRYIDNLAIIACGHGVVLDYIIGLEPESVKDVIVYLETRFKYRPPKFVINDNSCQVERNGKLVRIKWFPIVYCSWLPLVLLQLSLIL